VAVNDYTEVSIEVLLKRLPHAQDLPLPKRATEDAAGFDLRACVDDDLQILPGARALVPSGLAIQLPVGYEAQVRPRSGLAIKHGLTLLNSPGTIDADYRGEIAAVMINLGAEAVTIRRGDRIAQLIVQMLPRVRFQEVTDLSETARGAGGFGHTG
jgi:dUTP pyrophosphatase